MDTEKVSFSFPLGEVKHVVQTQKLVIWLGRLIYIGLGIGVVWLSRQIDLWILKFLYYLLVCFFAWQAYLLGRPKIFIGQKGLVIELRSTSLETYGQSIIKPESQYVFVAYDHLIGFTEDWRFLQVLSLSGGIVTLPTDLAFVSYKEKMILLAYIRDGKEGILKY